MHPDDLQLAAYLDTPPGSDEHARLRAHVLTCARCAARVARLRDDERRMRLALASAPLRPLTRRPQPRTPWLAARLGGAAAAAMLGVALVAVLLGARGGTLGANDERLVVADQAGRRAVVLAADGGATLAEITLAGQPRRLVYDAPRGRIYALTDRGVEALDLQARRAAELWRAPNPTADRRAGLALDANSARLYVPLADGVAELALDADTAAVARTFRFGRQVGALALAADAGVLFALDEPRTTLWRIDLARGEVTAQVLSQAPRQGAGALALSPDMATLFVLLGVARGGEPPTIWRIDARSGVVLASRTLAILPPPWDLRAIDAERIALARSDGSGGDIELRDAATLGPHATLGESSAAHHLAGGTGGELFAIDWLRGTVARYDGAAQRWRVARDDWQPWDAVLLPGP